MSDLKPKAKGSVGVDDGNRAQLQLYENQSDLEKACPGVPSPIEMAEALFGEERRITCPVREGTTVKEHLEELKEVVMSKLEVYGLRARRSYNCGNLFRGKNGVGDCQYPADNLWSDGRKWCFLCSECADNEILSVLSSCKIQCRSDGTVCKSNHQMVASMEHEVFLTVEQVFFHDKQCCDNSQTFYPKSCGVTMFDFDKIIGKDTYEKAVSKIK